MGKFINLTGQVFGRLTVVERAENKGKQPAWRCRCSCGNEKIVSGGNLKSGSVASCGCLQRERASAAHFKDLTGQTFGRLTVLERAENTKSGSARWFCRCSCDKEKIVAGSHLMSGKTTSCGCYNAEKITVHGLRHSRTYNTWRKIKARCYNPNDKHYDRYGGRGISVYPVWIHNFQAFYDYVSKLEHFGEECYSLDRINNDGNYEPDNLRWATAKTQARNRCNNVIVEYNGRKMTLTEASEKSGICFKTLKDRLKRGETGEYLFRLPKR